MTCDFLIINSSSKNIKHSAVIYYYSKICFHNQYIDDDSHYVMSAISENWFYIFCEYEKLQFWNDTEEKNDVYIINSDAILDEKFSSAMSWDVLKRFWYSHLILKKSRFHKLSEWNRFYVNKMFLLINAETSLHKLHEQDEFQANTALIS